MRKKGEYYNLPVYLTGNFFQPFNNHFMSEMHTIKCAKGYYGIADLFKLVYMVIYFQKSD